MRLVVTGASGRIGRYCMRALAEAGHEVRGVDRVPATVAGIRLLTADLTHAGEVYGALAGADAVVHMGAWANAGIVPDVRTYADNVTATFNVFQACADLGIQRIVSASSAQVYGFAAQSPVYVLADEEHPLRPTNCYAAAKIAGEEAASYFSARYGLRILSFRIMGARAPDEMDANLDRIHQNPAADSGLLWTRTDARDVAAAARQAVEADQVESGPYNITGAEVAMEVDSASLIQRYCGGTEIRPGLQGRASPLSCAKARRVFGYAPRFRWSMRLRHPES